MLGGFSTVRLRQRPVPVLPSSQSAHPAGHAAQLGPKKPDAHDSQDAPVKPVGHVQVPVAEQTPLPEHGGEHADDCRSSSPSEPEAPEGSCDMSGTESQKIRRLLPAVSATQTSDAIAMELADRGVEEDELPSGVEGRLAKEAFPE